MSTVRYCLDNTHKYANKAEVIKKMKAVHPYEEVAFDVYSLEDF